MRLDWPAGTYDEVLLPLLSLLSLRCRASTMMATAKCSFNYGLGTGDGGSSVCGLRGKGSN